jgi:hypothetical protein
VLLATDVDADAGVAAVWLVRRPGSARQVEETRLYERGPGGWQELGGCAGIGGKGIGPDDGVLAARPSATRNGPGSMRIVAVGRDGSVLTELGSEDYLDSLTLASLDDTASVPSST